MDLINQYSLTSYQENLMTLNRLINEPFICKYILKIKDEEEKKDSQGYHNELWSLLMGLYYNCKEYPRYSYVLDGKHFIYNIDKKLEFYYLTGISFQSREILLDTIKNDLLDWVPPLTHLFEEDKKEKDKELGKLSNLIIVEMSKLEKKKLNFYMTIDPEGKKVIHFS